MVPSFTQLLDLTSEPADQDSYTTASISPTASRLLLLGVVNFVASGTAAIPTVTGGGVGTWTEVVTGVSASGTRRLTLFRAATGGSPTSGTLVIDFATATQISCHWGVVEVADCTLTGTNGADGIAQSKATVSGPNTALFTVTGDSAWGATDNRAVGFFFTGATRTLSAVSPATLLDELASTPTGSGYASLYGRDGTNPTLAAQFTTGSNAGWSAGLVEIVGATESTPPEVTFDYPVVAGLRLNGGLN
jgi:hypothetical protein